MRKVQSSAALLERQRNPGVGYWTSRPDNSSADVRTSISSNSSELPSRTASPKPAATKNEEEVNLEYLRNVILQFLEHKEMRVGTFRPFYEHPQLIYPLAAQSRQSVIHHITFYSSRNPANHR